MNIQKEFGLELLNKIKNNENIINISKWAFRFYNNNIGSINLTFKEDIWDLVLIQEGEEFELSYEEIEVIANKYINYDELKDIANKYVETE